MDRDNEFLDQLLSLGGRVRDIQELIRALEDAATIYDDPNKYEGITDNRKVASEVALRAAMLYLREQGIPNHLLDLLLYPISLLEDMGQGPKKPLLEAIDWATAAAAVDLAMEAGDNLQVALRKATQATGGKLSTATLRDFRKNLRTGRARSEAIARYHFILKWARKPHVAQAARAAFVLRQVRGIFQPSKV